MKIFWNESPLTATQVIEALKEDSQWSPKTIHTLIARLVKKEALGVNKDSNLFQYYPLVSKEDCIGDETRSFLQKVCDGSFSMLLANFVKNESLSAKEIQDLKKLLDEKMS